VRRIAAGLSQQGPTGRTRGRKLSSLPPNLQRSLVVPLSDRHMPMTRRRGAPGFFRSDKPWYCLLRSDAVRFARKGAN
jgi:hypothetical protein